MTASSNLPLSAYIAFSHARVNRDPVDLDETVYLPEWANVGAVINGLTPGDAPSRKPSQRCRDCDVTWRSDDPTCWICDTDTTPPPRAQT